MTVTIVAVQKRAATFRIAVNKFYTFLLCKDLAAYILRIKRFCFAEIFHKTGRQPNRDYVSEEHKYTPESYEGHDDEINRPKELIKREEWG